MKLMIKKTVGVAIRDHRKMRAKHEKVYLDAGGSAMKRAAASAKTEARREVASASGIKQKAIKGRLGISKSSGLRGRRAGTITIYYSGAKMPLEAFSAPRQTRKGVRAGKHSVEGGFLATSTRGRTSGKPTVFKRRGPGRGPIERQGVDLTKYRSQFLRGAKRGFEKTYTKRLIHEYDRRLKKAGLK